MYKNRYKKCLWEEFDGSRTACCVCVKLPVNVSLNRKY